uniref:PTS system, IIC component n=1 Tax=Vibrio coralliilyticus TaxID=190893 RepID=M1FVB1_9VIBR|nr:PTS system, IIC component [Vibrio coralliilyticus]
MISVIRITLVLQAAGTKSEQKKRNNTPFKCALKSIANIFVPLIPAFFGAGISGGIVSVFQNMTAAGRIEGEAWSYSIMVLNINKSGLFCYLNIYFGINAAKVFGATQGLGGVVAGIISSQGYTRTSMTIKNPIIRPNVNTCALYPGIL